MRFLYRLRTLLTRSLRISQELRWWAKWLVLTAGHMGALGRAALFMGVAILMFRAMGDNGPDAKNQNTVSKALNQLTVRSLIPVQPLHLDDW